MISHTAWQDLLTGGLVVATGVFVVVEASGYPLGSLVRIGPGVFPLALGTLLIALGLGIAAFERIGALFPARAALIAELRALIVISAAIGLFGWLIERAGLAPAVFAAAFLAEAAKPGFAIGRQTLVAMIITAVSVILFVFLLGLPFRIVGW